jgi:arylsulfatase A-like enzyme
MVSDHGFSTIGENGDVARVLRDAGIKSQSAWKNFPSDGDVVTVGNGGSMLLYVIGKSPVVIEKIVKILQQRDASGVVFTRDGLPGTFPLSAVMLDSPTAPDVLVSSTWKMLDQSPEPRKATVVNDGYNDYKPGGGMHVTLSPTDLHNTAVAAGPDFRRGFASSLPSGNVDIAPTLLWLMGIKPPEPLDGRVLGEAITDGAAPKDTVKPGRLDAKSELPGGTWEQYIKFTELGGVRYLEEGNGHWTARPTASTSGAQATGK